MSIAVETGPPIQLIPAHEYPEHFISAVDRAKHRIGVLTMVMSFDEATEPMFSALERAAERQVPEIIVPDAYSTMFDDNIWRYQLWTGEGRQARANIAGLTGRLGGLASYASVEQRFIHPYRRLDKLTVAGLFAGRNHIKSYDIDDMTDIGGVMWGKRYFAALDYMLRIQHAGAADFMYGYKQELLRHGRFKGVLPYRVYPISDAHDLVIDMGWKNESFIYDTARRLAANAEELTLVSQYPPKGRFRQILAARPKDATHIYHNRPGQFVPPGRYLRQVETGLPPHLDYRSALDGFFIHAKLVLAKLKDGTHVTIGTSHNQNQTLVRLGTAEAALISRDPALYRAFELYLRHLPLERPGETI